MPKNESTVVRSSTYSASTSLADVTPIGVAFISDKVGYLVASRKGTSFDRGTLFATDNGGRSWRHINTGQYTVSNVSAVGKQLWMECTRVHDKKVVEHVLLLSMNQGVSFRVVSHKNFAELNFVTKNVGWAIPQTDRLAGKVPLFKTTDAGRSWRQVPYPAPGEVGLQSLSFSDPMDGMLLMAGQPGTGQEAKAVLRTTDGGQHWIMQANVAFNSRLTIHGLSALGYANGIQFVPESKSVAWLWESRGNLLKTTDGGENWTNSELTHPDAFEARSASFVSLDKGFVLFQEDYPKMEFRLERTSDGGRTWSVLHTWRLRTGLGSS